MPWIGNQFIYTKRLLRTIADNYPLHYGLPAYGGELITNPWSLAEYKADFDLALNNLGRGKWTGNLGVFSDYRYFGRRQQIVIVDILGIIDPLGFYDIPKLRRLAYGGMAKFLNGGE